LPGVDGQGLGLESVVGYQTGLRALMTPVLTPT